MQVPVRFPLVAALINGAGWFFAIVLPGPLFADSERRWLHLMTMGAVIGTAEWLTLRRCVRLSPAWIAPYALVWFAAWFIGLEYGDIFTPNIFWLGGLGGAVIGATQWMTLRTVAHGAWLWILACAGAGIFGCWLGVIAGFQTHDLVSSDWDYPVGALVAGLVMGLLRGLTLKALPART